MKYHTHIASYFEREEGFFLLNHDINGQSWSSVYPLLPELSELIVWSSDPLSDPVAVDALIGVVEEINQLEDDSDDNDSESVP